MISVVRLAVFIVQIATQKYLIKYSPLFITSSSFDSVVLRNFLFLRNLTGEPILTSRDPREADRSEIFKFVLVLVWSKISVRASDSKV